MNDIDKSYYECKRCFYKCYQLIDMKKHLNKKTICKRELKSYDYDEDKLSELSLIRHYNITKNDYECNDCGKVFLNSSNLNRHVKSYCKKIKIDNINKDMSKDISKDMSNDKDIINDKDITNNNASLIIGNNNNSNNETTLIDTQNITNNITNNISLNIKLISTFDKELNTEHIDEKTKLILLLNNSKFTSTLENILENEVNLNVLMDNTSNNGLVYMDNDIKHLAIKDIVKKIMEKLHKHINDFKNDVSKLNVNPSILTSELEVANKKYKEFNKYNEVQDHVKTCITDIYNKKKDDTVSTYKSIKEGY